MELRPTLTMGRCNQQTTAGHIAQEHGRRIDNLDETEPCLELLGQVLNEPRPVIGPWNNRLQGRQHLTAVADAECKTVRPRKKCLELFSCPAVKQD